MLDHGLMWLDGTGRHVLSGEPYDFTAKLEQWSAFQAACAALGCVVTIEPDSSWFPPHTTLVLVRQTPNATMGRVEGIAESYDGPRGWRRRKLRWP
jgi:hypothetical protein